MREDGKIDYIDLVGGDVAASKAFYAEAFGWTFVDYGPDYAAFSEGLDGGLSGDPADGVTKPVVVLFTRDLEAMLARVEAAGGKVIRPIFSFPGGRRFHFLDPAGNEMAVWAQ